MVVSIVAMITSQIDLLAYSCELAAMDYSLFITGVLGMY
jgi:hypothetical protein